jgi:hypothetical protein
VILSVLHALDLIPLANCLHPWSLQSLSTLPPLSYIRLKRFWLDIEILALDLLVVWELVSRILWVEQLVKDLVRCVKMRAWMALRSCSTRCSPAHSFALLAPVSSSGRFDTTFAADFVERAISWERSR